MSGVRKARLSVADLAARFPAGFTWGTATSAYQIEGAVTDGGRGSSIWDAFVREGGRIRGGDTADVAADHYHRYLEDVELMAMLGVGAYRFSVAWPRVLPDGTGAVNPAGLDFYDRLVDALLQHGIQPLLSLYHWDLPQALQERGGWANPEMPVWFADYGGVVAGRLGDRVQQWLTINEPQVFAFTGHGSGRHAPGVQDWPTALRVADAALRAHAAAAERVRSLVPDARIGVALDLNLVEPASSAPGDLEAADRHRAFRQRWFLDPLFGRGYPPAAYDAYAEAGMLDGVAPDPPAGTPDFLGVNYYTRETIAAADELPHRTRFVLRDGVKRTTMGWEIQAQGLTQVLVDIHREYAPRAVLITENGAAFADLPDDAGHVEDEPRRSFLEAHILAAADAIAAGVPLEGYFVWSLLDNFEWDKGFGQRFGIVRVEYATQRRTLKSSGDWYRRLIAASRGSEQL